jgi:hypothetical protein
VSPTNCARATSGHAAATPSVSACARFLLVAYLGKHASQESSNVVTLHYRRHNWRGTDLPTMSGQDQALLDFMTYRIHEAVIFDARPRRCSVALELEYIHQDHFSATLRAMHHTHSLKKTPPTTLKDSRFLWLSCQPPSGAAQRLRVV